MGADHLTVFDRRDLGGVGLDHVQRAGLAALAADVDEHQRVVALHHLVGEIEPADAEVEDRDSLGQLALSEALGDVAAEAVVGHPGVADPGDEDLTGALARFAHESTASTSPALKNRYLPVSRNSSCAGSSSTVTAMWAPSS